MARRPDFRRIANSAAPASPTVRNGEGWRGKVLVLPFATDRTSAIWPHWRKIVPLSDTGFVISADGSKITPGRLK